MDITLKDGPVVHIITQVANTLSIGDKMMINDVEAAPNDYKTNSGLILTVGENGVITEVSNDDSMVVPIGDNTDIDELIETLKVLINKIEDDSEEVVETEETEDFSQNKKEEKLKFFSKK